MKPLSHLRRFPFEILNASMWLRNCLLGCVGILNRLLSLVDSVAVVYPGNDAYTRAYLYAHRVEQSRWEPWLCGLLIQNRKVSILFCITATDSMFTDPAYVPQLRKLAERTDQLRILVGARRKTFAGILPGILFAKRIIRESPEADTTAYAVVKAITLVQQQEGLDTPTPIVILGGKGFIGKRICALLDPTTTFCIDKDGQGWPSTQKRLIVVNVTTPATLTHYIDLLPPRTIVLNEVYPEPTADVLRRLQDRHCSCYHVVGVQGCAIPPFPEAYRGAIPCCAAWSAPTMDVVVRKLTSG